MTLTEHCVQVHIHQVIEVLHVHTGYGIASAVGVCECVKECLQGSLEEVYEGLLRFKLSTPTEYTTGIQM